MGYLIIINKEDCATTTQKSSTMIYISLNWPVTISGNHVQKISINKWTICHNNIKKAIQKHQPTQAFLHPIHVDNFADIKICSVTCFSNILNSCTWFFSITTNNQEIQVIWRYASTVDSTLCFGELDDYLRSVNILIHFDTNSIWCIQELIY